MSALYRFVSPAVALADPADKAAALHEVAGVLACAYPELDRSELLESLEEREALGSTGFGRGIALPHARSDRIKRPVAAFVRLAHPIDFASTDGLPVDMLVGLVSPVDAGVGHLHALAALSRMMRDDALVEALRDAPDAEAIFALIANIADRDAA